MEWVYDFGYVWVMYFIVFKVIIDMDFCVLIGGLDCCQFYFVLFYNILVMSFGVLLVNVIIVLNMGVWLGGFVYDIGEGGISCYYWQNGGDLIYQVVLGYFGCWDENGCFDLEKFCSQVVDLQIKMIELKLS